MTNHPRINYPDKANAQCDCDVIPWPHLTDGSDIDEPDYIQQLETALDIAETKLARIELVLNDLKYDVRASVESYDDLIREVING